MAFQSKYTGSQIESILGNEEKKIVAITDLGYDSFDQILGTSFDKESCLLSYCSIDGITNLVDLMKFVFFTKDASKGYSIDLSVKLNGNIIRGLTCSISSVVDDYRLNIFDPESLLGGYITYDNSTPEILISKAFELKNLEDCNINLLELYKINLSSMSADNARQIVTKLRNGTKVLLKSTNASLTYISYAQVTTILQNGTVQYVDSLNNVTGSFLFYPSENNIGFCSVNFTATDGNSYLYRGVLQYELSGANTIKLSGVITKKI